MRLAFVYCPVRELEPALAFYRDQLGFEVDWREGDATVGLKLAGTDVSLMLDVDDGASGAKVCPMFQVESVDAFYEEHRATLRFIREPRDIPGGRLASFVDPSGNLIEILDESRPV